MKLRFEIESSGEKSAGIIGFTDVVNVHVESGDPGGEKGEFQEYMKSCLSDWFDGAHVEIKDAQEDESL